MSENLDKYFEFEKQVAALELQVAATHAEMDRMWLLLTDEEHGILNARDTSTHA